MKDPMTDGLNSFLELVGILDEEELLRFRRRFQMRNNERMAEILSDELAEREGLARAALKP